MKKARITLSCIALLAVVGAAFAFKAMTTQGRAYTHNGAFTTSTTVTFGKSYTALVPVCVPLSIGPSIAYLSNAGVAATSVYSTTLLPISFSTTTAGGAWETVTRTTALCDVANPKANTFLTIIP